MRGWLERMRRARARARGRGAARGDTAAASVPRLLEIARALEPIGGEQLEGVLREVLAIDPANQTAREWLARVSPPETRGARVSPPEPRGARVSPLRPRP